MILRWLPTSPGDPFTKTNNNNMAYKILAVVGFATIVAMASATAATEEVRVLEAKLAAAKAKFAAEQNSVQAEGNKRHIRADTG